MFVTIRSACPEDVPYLVEMINRFAIQNMMIPRTEEEILQSLPDWLVAEVQTEQQDDSDDRKGRKASFAPAAPPVIGCGALMTLTEDLAEIRSLAVHEGQQSKGVGSLLVEHIIALAQARDFQQVCALTLRKNFFIRLGFQVVDGWSISSKLWKKSIYCPKSHPCNKVAVLMNLTKHPEELATVPLLPGQQTGTALYAHHRCAR